MRIYVYWTDCALFSYLLFYRSILFSDSGHSINGRGSGGGRGTLRLAADATWRPEMNYRRLRVPTATRCYSCSNIFGKCGQISIIISLPHSEMNCRRGWNKISHLGSYTLPNYLAKIE